MITTEFVIGNEDISIYTIEEETLYSGKIHHYHALSGFVPYYSRVEIASNQTALYAFAKDGGSIILAIFPCKSVRIVLKTFRVIEGEPAHEWDTVDDEPWD